MSDEGVWEIKVCSYCCAKIEHIDGWDGCPTLYYEDTYPAEHPIEYEQITVRVAAVEAVPEFAAMRAGVSPPEGGRP